MSPQLCELIFPRISASHYLMLLLYRSWLNFTLHHIQSISCVILQLLIITRNFAYSSSKSTKICHFKIQRFLGRDSPLQDSFHVGRDSSPRNPSHRRFRRLDSWAFGDRPTPRMKILDPAPYWAPTFWQLPLPTSASVDATGDRSCS